MYHRVVLNSMKVENSLTLTSFWFATLVFVCVFEIQFYQKHWKTNFLLQNLCKNLTLIIRKQHKNDIFYTHLKCARIFKERLRHRIKCTEWLDNLIGIIYTNTMTKYKRRLKLFSSHHSDADLLQRNEIYSVCNPLFWFN